MEGPLLTNHDVVRHVRRSAERQQAIVNDSEIPLFDPVDPMEANDRLACVNRSWLDFTAERLERLREHPDLDYLNRCWRFHTAPLPTSPGPFQRLRGWIHAKISGIVVSVLTRYFRQERDFLANLVRVQNEMARRLDDLADGAGRSLEVQNEMARRIDLLTHEMRTLDGATHRFSVAFREAFAELEERDEILRMLLEKRLEKRAPGNEP